MFPRPRASNMVALRGRIGACRASCPRPLPPSLRSSSPVVRPRGWGAPTRPVCRSPGRPPWNGCCAPPPSAVASSSAPAARMATCSPHATAPASCSRTRRAPARSPRWPEGPDEATVLVLGGDMPMLRPETLAALAARSAETARVAALEGAEGQLQFLGAAWPVGRLRAALEAIERPEGGWADLSLRRLYA